MIKRRGPVFSKSTKYIHLHLLDLRGRPMVDTVQVGSGVRDDGNCIDSLADGRVRRRSQNLDILNPSLDVGISGLQLAQ